MMLPMLIVVHGNPLFNKKDSIARWEQTVSSMLQNEAEAANVITTAKAQLQIMESWLGSLPYEREVYVSLKLLPYKLKICLQRH